MGSVNILEQVVSSIKFVGYKRTIFVIISRLADYIFDYRFKTDTVECVPLKNLQVQKKNKQRGQRYQPTGILPFKKLMLLLKLPVDFVFVDFGSGKGRVLLMASQYNFKRVVGIEFSAKLCKIAEDNIRKFNKKTIAMSRIDIIESDVCDYVFDDEENVFYFFHPFDEIVMKRVINNIAVSLERKPRQAFLIYYLPIHIEAIEKQMTVFKKKEHYTLNGYECVVFSTGSMNK